MRVKLTNRKTGIGTRLNRKSETKRESGRKLPAEENRRKAEPENAYALLPFPYLTLRRIFGALILFYLAVVFFSCTKKIYVPVETKRTETEYRFLRDSIYVRDSIFVKEKGDTVWVDRYRYLYKDRFFRDTVFVRDSVSYPVVVETVKKERYVPKFFWWCFAIAAATVGWTIGKILLKWKKRL